MVHPNSVNLILSPKEKVRKEHPEWQRLRILERRQNVWQSNPSLKCQSSPRPSTQAPGLGLGLGLGLRDKETTDISG